MHYEHVDVFSSKPLKGNGLTTVFPEQPLADELLLSIAQEFKQYETIFIFPQDEQGAFPCRVFTMEEELPFAGHPLLGAAAVIHKRFFKEETEQEITLNLSGRIVQLTSSIKNGTYGVVMNQGKPNYINQVSVEYYQEICEALSIDLEDLDANYPIEVVSTGLPNLLVPLRQNIDQVKINRPDFEALIGTWQAKFAYIFDTRALECRTWDNQGKVEDVATGSAAGPLVAALVRNGKNEIDERIRIHQGKYVGRPSVIEGWVTKDNEVCIQGNVAFFAEGYIEL